MRWFNKYEILKEFIVKTLHWWKTISINYPNLKVDLDRDTIQDILSKRKELHKSMEKNQLLQFSTFNKFGFFDLMYYLTTSMVKISHSAKTPLCTLDDFSLKITSLPNTPCWILYDVAFLFTIAARLRAAAVM